MVGKSAALDPFLEGLAHPCAAGGLDGCDALYFESDVFSAYERYGSTCGGRSSRVLTRARSGSNGASASMKRS